MRDVTGEKEVRAFAPRIDPERLLHLGYCGVLVDVRSRVADLVPDPAGVRPLIIGITDDDDTGVHRHGEPAARARRRDDLDVAVVVDVGDGRREKLPGTVHPEFVELGAVGPVEDHELAARVGDDLGPPIAVEVESDGILSRVGVRPSEALLPGPERRQIGIEDEDPR